MHGEVPCPDLAQPITPSVSSFLSLPGEGACEGSRSSGCVDKRDPPGPDHVSVVPLSFELNTLCAPSPVLGRAFRVGSAHRLPPRIVPL